MTTTTRTHTLPPAARRKRQRQTNANAHDDEEVGIEHRLGRNNLLEIGLRGRLHLRRSKWKWTLGLAVGHEKVGAGRGTIRNSSNNNKRAICEMRWTIRIHCQKLTFDINSKDNKRAICETRWMIRIHCQKLSFDDTVICKTRWMKVKGRGQSI